MAEDVREGPLRLGDKFLKYVIRGLVGKGGHAWVYAGRDDFLERDVAIKLLHRAGGITSDMVRRGRAEAQLLHRLRHANVVEVLDAGITDAGQLYIVMELLRGRTLREVLRSRGRLTVSEAVPLFIEIASGVEAAHALNAVHRDLKPENIFVLHDNTPKILDFGIAKVIDSAFTTEKDVIHGTMLYMAPEQLEGYRATARSDIYSFGLILFETLLGRHPCLLGGGAPTLRELALIQTAKVPPPLDELDPTIPRHLARTVARAMAKRPEQRFATVSELVAALRESLARHTADLQLDRVSVRTGTVTPNLGAIPDTDREFEPPMFTSTEPQRGAPELVSSPANASSFPNTLPPVTRVREPSDEHGRRRHRTRQRSLRRVLAAGAAVGTVAGGVAASLVTLPESPSSSAERATPVVARGAVSARATMTPRPPEPRAAMPAAPPILEPPATEEAAPSSPPSSVANMRSQKDVPLTKPKPLVKVNREQAAGSTSSDSLAPPERKAWAE